MLSKRCVGVFPAPNLPQGAAVPVGWSALGKGLKGGSLSVPVILRGRSHEGDQRATGWGRRSGQS